MSMMEKGNVWVNENGQFLILSQRDTHTGRHYDVSYAPDLNEATVIQVISREILKRCPDLQLLHPLPAQLEVKRTVKILGKEHDKA